MKALAAKAHASHRWQALLGCETAIIGAKGLIFSITGALTRFRVEIGSLIFIQSTFGIDGGAYVASFIGWGNSHLLREMRAMRAGMGPLT